MHIALYGSRRANRGLGLVVGCGWAVNNTKMTITMYAISDEYIRRLPPLLNYSKFLVTCKYLSL